MVDQKREWNIWVDTGGTFTDCLGIDPESHWHRTKVLSSSGLRGTISEVEADNKLIIQIDWSAPDDFINGFEFKLLDRAHPPLKVAEFEANQLRITLTQACAENSWKGQSFEIISLEESPVLAARLITKTPPDKELPPINLRLATTRGTNALLEFEGTRTALFITEGFGDLLKIGNQQRPDLFALNIQKPSPLYEQVLEVKERMDASGNELTSVDFAALNDRPEKLLNDGVQSAAIVCMNSYLNSSHEEEVEQWLRDLGFNYISISSKLSNFIKILPRAKTTIVNAYLEPILQSYFDGIEQKILGGDTKIMTSAGGLMNRSQFTPKDGLLSGPAAGVVGAAAAGEAAGFKKIISFDMGGTSTDVSRYDGDFEYVFEHSVGDARLMVPAISIETVAAGGGSICSYDGHVLQVGPQSAGASPGPACYGVGGPLTMTDINVLAGRLDEHNFHIPIDIIAARKKLDETVHEVRRNDASGVTAASVIEGFIDIANQRMVATIEKVSLRKGYDPASYVLVSFGGAGGQHCCGITRRLGIEKIVVPKDAGLLSAYGLGHAVTEHFEEEQIFELLSAVNSEIPDRIKKLSRKALDKLSEQGVSESMAIRRRLIFMRLKGQESTLEIEYRSDADWTEKFRKAYQNRYGHWVENATIEVESLRVVASTRSKVNDIKKSNKTSTKEWKPAGEKEILFNGDKRLTPVYNRAQAVMGAQVKGPALILDPYSTLVVEPDWKLSVNENESLVLHQTKKSVRPREFNQTETVKLELFTHRFTTIAEKMGEMLQRTAISVNVKERQDFSCALLNPEGELVVNAPHIPVHLGALGICVRSVMERIDMEPGDAVVTNHPAFGGSHLPDVTVISPVFTDNEELIGYTANRAHHAEIGGTRPGSMPPDATNLGQEGVVISPTYLVNEGEPQFKEIEKLLRKAEYPSRNPEENMNDLRAQLAASRQGASELKELAGRQGVDEVHHYMQKLKSRSANLMQQTIRDIPNGTYKSRELLDDETPLCATLIIDNNAVVIDFEGTGAVHPRNLNATPAIVTSVVMYVLRVLVNQPIPLNEGLMESVRLNLPECLLNPAFNENPDQCPAVVGGNIEISQRLTDTLLKPFDRIACGQGTMNNVLFGNDSFGYYETVGGGSGAGPEFNGADGVHQHMTNTRGTDPEILEQRYPVRLDRYAIRENSGGQGKHRGGDGIIREMTFLKPVELSVLAEHRVQAPYGRQGGQAGKTGKQWVIRKNGKRIKLEPADSCDIQPEDRFVLHTPGGGGFGEIESDK